MGLHHDGEVDAFWLQLEGRRTVTIGPRVRAGTPEELDERLARESAARGGAPSTSSPASLFHLPARTPHAVVCRRRSLAVTLTWARAARLPGPTAEDAVSTDAPLAWDVVVGASPSRSRRPTRARSGRRCRSSPAASAASATCACGRPTAKGRGCPPAPPPGPTGSPDAAPLRALAVDAGLEPLIGAGLLGPHDLPLRIRPADPAALDGWRFA